MTLYIIISWWRHQRETFSALLAYCAGNSPVPVNSPHNRPVTRSFDVIFDLRPNKRLSKQPWSWWFETSSWSLWRQCNGYESTLDPAVSCCLTHHFHEYGFCHSISSYMSHTLVHGKLLKAYSNTACLLPLLLLYVIYHKYWTQLVPGMTWCFFNL